ncbi:hypothetical protein [Dyadobacter diqingensis]|uniref:hypothetical protein n=1 Tax=Dyadobacter diqingensis TaxID=2938121 RepID=UPI0020C190FA|nr:hypothetical protein [Dyadobacter diqingensis]
MKTKPGLSKTHILTMAASAMFTGLSLLGSTAAFAQVKIGTNPTTINPANNLEVESSTTGRKVTIDKTTSKVTIADGTQGDGYILTSDPSGEASWKKQKITSTYTFQQPAGILLNLPNGAGCNMLSCATDLNRNGSFTITNAVNDIVFDIAGFYSVGNNSVALLFNFYLAVDLVTPGVFVAVDGFGVSHSGISCSAGTANFKSILKNLPPRTYNVKVYASAFTNTGTAAKLGIGSEAYAGCGINDYNKQNLIISVSQ